MKKTQRGKSKVNLDLYKTQEFPSLNACKDVVIQQLAQETWIDRQGDPDHPRTKERFGGQASDLSFEELQKLIAGKIPLTAKFREKGCPDARTERAEKLYTLFVEKCQEWGIPEKAYRELRPRRQPFQKVFTDLEARFPLPDLDPEADRRLWRRTNLKAYHDFIRKFERDLVQRAADFEKPFPHSSAGQPLVRRYREARNREVSLSQQIEWFVLHDFAGWSIERLRQEKNPRRVERQAIQAVLRKLRTELGVPAKQVNAK